MKNILPDSLRQTYQIEKILKENEQNCVCLLRECATRKRMIGRRFAGNGEVYQMLQGIACTNLPQIERVLLLDDEVFVLEEYIQGDTLDFLLDETPLPEEYARRIFLQICHALQALHGVGAVHRDIKPENIILRGDEAILIDFDASRLCKPDHLTDTRVMGTTGYAAPEQFGFAQTDARADIYSMGVLLNVMLTRRHPASELAEGELRKVIERCTVTNVDKRYQSVAELVRALEKKTTPRWVRGGAVLLALLAVGLGVYAAANREQPQEPDVVPAVVQEAEQTPTEPETVPERIEPMEQLQPEPIIEKPVPEPPAEEPPLEHQEPVLLSEELWTGNQEYELMEFQYDLDGDGVMEDYVFSPGFYIIDGINPVFTDGFLAFAGGAQRKVVPAVWRWYEDGTREIANEFSSLLTDPHVTVYPGQPGMAGTPEVEACSLDVWSGGVQAVFSPECAGSWVMHAEAVLDGQTLSAMGTCYPKAN